MIPDCPECGGTGCGAPEFEDEMGASMCDGCAGTGMTPAGMAAESAAKDAVIRRLLDGWKPTPGGEWSKLVLVVGCNNEWVFAPMSDAHRAVLEGLT